MWYYTNGEGGVGPVDLQAFRQLIDGGVIHANTLIWKKGWGEWRPATVSGLIAGGDISHAGARPVPPPLPGVEGADEAAAATAAQAAIAAIPTVPQIAPQNFAPVADPQAARDNFWKDQDDISDIVRQADPAFGESYAKGRFNFPWITLVLQFLVGPTILYLGVVFLIGRMTDSEVSPGGVFWGLTAVILLIGGSTTASPVMMILQRKKIVQFVEWIWENKNDLTAGKEMVYQNRIITPDDGMTELQVAASIVVMTYRTSAPPVVTGVQNKWLYACIYTLATWGTGLWGLPWGPIYTLMITINNLRGGDTLTVGEIIDELNQLERGVYQELEQRLGQEVA